jgi:serine/threonine protein phosphatase PrpC
LSTLDSGPYGTFVGIYDGHGGPETSRYVNDHLFQHLKSKKPNPCELGMGSVLSI